MTRAVAVCAVLAALGCILFSRAAAAQQAPHVHTELPPPADDAFAGIDVVFELVGGDGEIVRADDFLGRYWLLGFGFTRCTDVCPIMVAKMAATIRLAGQQLEGAFVSVDTERDAPSDVDAYATGFDARITGLGGSIEQINTAAANFRVSYVVTKTQRSYTVQHTSHLFLIGPDGALVDVFPFTESPATIVAAIE